MCHDLVFRSSRGVVDVGVSQVFFEAGSSFPGSACSFESLSELASARVSFSFFPVMVDAS